MAVQVATPGMRRVNYRVPDLMFAADVGVGGFCTVDIPAMPAANATGIVNAASIATAGSVAPAASFNPATMMGRYGRTLTVALSGAGTPSIIITGYDYLGQALKETITAAGASAVAGKKAFYDITNIAFGAVAGTTLNVGFGAVLGVPYKVLSTALYGEMMNDAIATAGALVAGVATQSIAAGTGDPRGNYTPNTAPNGTNFYRFTCVVDRNNLHGSAHVLS